MIDTFAHIALAIVCLSLAWCLSGAVLGDS
jgi:hypothetical protein